MGDRGTQPWRGMLDAIGEAVIVTDLEGVVTFWNAAAERLYGWTAEEVLGRSVLDVTPTSATREDAAAIMEHLVRGETWHGRFEVQRRGGGSFPALVTDAPVVDDDGRLVGIIGVSADLTDQLAAEAGALRWRREAALAELAGTAIEAMELPPLLQRVVEVLATELETPLAMVGELVEGGRAVRFVAGVGWEPGVVGGPPEPVGVTLGGPRGRRSVREDLTRLDPSSVSPVLRRHSAWSGVTVPVGGRGAPYGVLGVHDTKPRRFGREELAFLESVAGVVAGAVSRIAVEDELRSVVDRLSQSEEIRVAFLRATSHELRTPLAAIRGFAETLVLRDAEIAPEQRLQYLGVLATNAERLDRLIADLLDVDRLSSGLVLAMRRPCRVDELVQGIIDVTDHPDHELATDLEAVELSLDVAKMERVVHNLIVNALRHTPVGGRVTVRLRGPGKGAVLHVEDEGPGVPEELRDHIFDPFVQGPDQRHAPTPGTGLGLTLVREIVALHGGTVGVENLPGRGARFEVVLPDVP